MTHKLIYFLQMINIVMTELSSTHLKNSDRELRPESVAWIVWKVFETLQQYGQQEALREWAIVSIPRCENCTLRLTSTHRLNTALSSSRPSTQCLG